MKKQIVSAMILSAMTMMVTSAFAEEKQMMEKNETMMMQHEMNIVDVTQGEEIRGIITSADASGHATANYNGEMYKIYAEFSGLSEPKGDDFYEGWVVRKSPFAFISTGKIEKTDGKYINTFSSEEDYSDYDFYVVTLEPNDGDDAPAEHILEGDVISSMMVKEDSMMMENEETMMKKELTPTQKALRVEVKEKLKTIDISKIDIKKVIKKVKILKDNISERGLSAEKNETYLEILNAIEDVLVELDMMETDTMMEK